MFAMIINGDYVVTSAKSCCQFRGDIIPTIAQRFDSIQAAEDFKSELSIEIEIETLEIKSLVAVTEVV